MGTTESNLNKNDSFHSIEANSKSPFTSQENEKIINAFDNVSEMSTFLLFDRLEKHHHLYTIENFSNIVAKFIRSNKSTILETVWSLISKDPNPIYRLFVMTFQILQLNDAETSSAAKSMSEFIDSIRESKGQDDWNKLQFWFRSYGPCFTNIFETYFNTFCFHRIENSSLNVFKSPVLSSDSEILSRSDIILLSMYNTNLQGNWRRLYTSSNDGLSFNRVAHHIIGYEVRRLYQLS
jgi:hypothetical protein